MHSVNEKQQENGRDENRAGKKFRPAHTFLQNKRPAAHGPRPVDTHQYKEKP